MKTYCLDYSIWLLIPIFILLIVVLIKEFQKRSYLLSKQAEKRNGVYLKGNIFSIAFKNRDKYFPQIKFVHNNIPFHLFIKFSFPHTRYHLHTKIEASLKTSIKHEIWIAKKSFSAFLSKPNFGSLLTLTTDNPEIDRKIISMSPDPDSEFIKSLLTSDIVYKILEYRNKSLEIQIDSRFGVTLKVMRYPESTKAYDNFIGIATSLCDRLIELGWSP